MKNLKQNHVMFLYFHTLLCCCLFSPCDAQRRYTSLDHFAFLLFLPFFLAPSVLTPCAPGRGPSNVPFPAPTPQEEPPEGWGWLARAGHWGFPLLATLSPSVGHPPSSVPPRTFSNPGAPPPRHLGSCGSYGPSQGLLTRIF